MKILFLSRLFYPHIGGVEKHVLEVGDILQKKGHRITLLTEELDNATAKNYQKTPQSAKFMVEMNNRTHGWKIYHIPVGKSEKLKKFRIWWWIFKNISLIRSADIVHCHDVFFWYVPFRFLFPNKPVFTTFHGYETKSPPSENSITIRQWSERLSRGNICVGDYIKKWYKTIPTFVTYGGIDPKNIDVEKTEMSDKKNTGIVFFGRVSEDTGALFYNKAVKTLQKRGYNVFFTVVGDGKYRLRMTNAGKIASNAYNYYPFIKNAQIVFCSSYLSIMECMLLKKPVVAFYGNPLKKDYLLMAPFSPWIYPADSQESIANAVENILKNPLETSQKTEAAYEWVKTQTWENVSDLYLRIWKGK